MTQSHWYHLLWCETTIAPRGSGAAVTPPRWRKTRGVTRKVKEKTNRRQTGLRRRGRRRGRTQQQQQRQKHKVAPSSLIRISNWTNSRWQRCACQIRSCPGGMREREGGTLLRAKYHSVAEWVPSLLLSPSLSPFPLIMPTASPLSSRECHGCLNEDWQLKHHRRLEAEWERPAWVTERERKWKKWGSYRGKKREAGRYFGNMLHSKSSSSGPQLGSAWGEKGPPWDHFLQHMLIDLLFLKKIIL